MHLLNLCNKKSLNMHSYACMKPSNVRFQRLMYVMLTQDKPSCMEDAIEVMKSCGVKVKSSLYTFRLRQLVATDRVRIRLQLRTQLRLNKKKNTYV